ncbi:hypothetical protein DY000_02045809 [Brassica cretica]|uniref:AT-hook motif nuclear-localized protein n=1 Tax=Brassica cretica TaxID=69181 RepID=A0ABQ7EQC0_BRACR|nr:hypothetical protein DY000_02045809 [Brassica cretica]
MAGQEGYSDSESSDTVCSLEPAITTGFQIGVFSQTPSSGDSKAVKAVRRRPPGNGKLRPRKLSLKGTRPSNLHLHLWSLVASVSCGNRNSHRRDLLIGGKPS